ncbi:hypothetical protein QAD02_008801 [Eretmocerus hayati]|uniref:Uncharacterized protein n=1 Tax=Eretmocerus hayati TaxID=131215 RepID=A0ACC2N7X1_9HYME|nr:hypothetical protein QAD02_008801 [Eretmocerus hayati]
MSVEDKIRHYQKSIDKSISDNKRLMHCIHVLSKLPVTVAHLETTGIGRTVNSLRKIEDGVGDAAKELVANWKQMVEANNDTSEEEDEACVPDAPDSYESLEYDSEPEKSVRHRTLNNESSHPPQPQALRVPLPQSPPEMIIDTDDLQRSLEQSSNHSGAGTCDIEEEENEMLENHKVVISRDGRKKSAQSSKRSPSKDTRSKYDSVEKSSGKSRHSHTNEKKEASKSRKDEKKLDKNKSHEQSHQEKIRSTDKKRKLEHSSLMGETTKKRKDSKAACDDIDDLGGFENEEVGEGSDERERGNISEEEEDYKETKSDVESSQGHESSDNETESKSDRISKTKMKSRDVSEKSKNEKHSNSASDESSKKEKRKSEKHHSKESYSKSSKSHSSSSSKDRSHKKDESKHSKEKDSEPSKISKGEKDESSRDKVSSKESKDHKEKKKHGEHSSEKKSKSKKSKNREGGIDCNSGTSFADALGMCVMPPPSKKKKDNPSTSLQKPGKSEQPNSSRMSNQFTISSSKSPGDRVKDESLDSSESLHLLSPSMKLEPLDRIEDEVDLASTLPEPSPHYKPLPHINHAQRKMDEDVMLSQVLHVKNQRTKVYSGNKSGWSTVPSLSEMCTQILIENIDALEYTGGVPYYILKPVLERATPDQLITLEHFNPYLIEESDSLWQFHCNKDFRSKQREEMESWREMYMRCYEEREAKLKALTNNIKQSIDKSIPVRSTKLAYVDNYVKPPRSVLRKQAKYGTSNHTAPSDAKKKLIAAASGLGSSSNGSTSERISVPPPPLAGRMRQSSSMVKKVKAPLMAKALQAIKGRYKR